MPSWKVGTKTVEHSVSENKNKVTSAPRGAIWSLEVYYSPANEDSGRLYPERQCGLWVMILAVCFYFF